MTFEEAIKESIKKYFAGEEPKELKKASKSMKYNKKYFDKIQNDLIAKDKKKDTKDGV